MQLLGCHIEINTCLDEKAAVHRDFLFFSHRALISLRIYLLLEEIHCISVCILVLSESVAWSLRQPVGAGVQCEG